MKPKLLLIFLIPLILTASRGNAQALKATGGTGLYRPEIWWLTFSDLIGTNGLLAGESATRTFVVGGVTVTVLLDQVTFSGFSFQWHTSECSPGWIQAGKLFRRRFG